MVHMSDLDLTGKAQAHFRGVVWQGDSSRRPVFNRGGTVRVNPFLDHGVPYFVHDYFGPGRHAKIVSTKAADLMKDGKEYRSLPPLTGDESVVAEVSDVAWPKVLDPVDDLPPATVITLVRKVEGKLVVRGISHDNGEITAVSVNGAPAKIVSQQAGIADWEATLDTPADGKLAAQAQDKAGNTEQTAHRLVLSAVQLANVARP
jgi:hypothetical protein